MSDSENSKQYGVDGPPQLQGRSRELSDSTKTLLGWPDSEEDDWDCGVVCSCGESARFNIEQAREGSNPGWMNGKWGNEITDLGCAACNALIPLFHEGFHGYNAVVCCERDEMPENYVETNRQFLKRLKCDSCGQDEFHIAVGVRYDDDEIREGISDIPTDLWDDAYGWIQIDAWCASCQTIKKAVVDYETA